MCVRNEPRCHVVWCWFVSWIYKGSVNYILGRPLGVKLQGVHRIWVIWVLTWLVKVGGDDDEGDWRGLRHHGVGQEMVKWKFREVRW